MKQDIGRFFLIAFLFFITSQANAQNTEIQLLDNEYWYGAATNEAHKAPFAEGYRADLNANVYGNQASPILLSSKGRIIYSEIPFAFEFKNKKIIVSISDQSQLKSVQAGKTLEDAYQYANKYIFPPSGLLPDKLLFTSPQYNTWIELIYDQNQEDILKYAHDIINNGFPPGVIMIDDNWAPYYGRFEFRKDRFPDAGKMIDELHSLGFKVMVWVCPFIRPDSEEGRFLMKKRWVLMDNNSNTSLKWEDSEKPAIVQWWNGFSMVMDFTNPEAVEWYQNQLDFLVKEYKIDGFKFDAGDPEFYSGNVIGYKDVSPNRHTELWGEFGLKYPLNEYRAMWKLGGKPLVQRLRDKFHTWEDLQKLIPHITTASLLGYTFACPDMIGGGDFSSFIDVSSDKLDQELIVRSAQSHTLMPMMQFSVAPWRVLNATNLAAVKKSVEIRKAFLPEIMSLAEKSAQDGTPIVSSMEYVFPNQGFEMCKDQFMLGKDILVAPIVTKNNVRTVVLPKGRWIDFRGKKVKGGQSVKYTISIDELAWFRRIK